MESKLDIFWFMLGCCAAGRWNIIKNSHNERPAPDVVDFATIPISESDGDNA